MSGLPASPATCFGKVPTRGDFVKGPNQHQLIDMLDRWMSSCMELMSEDPRWKTAYDQAPPVDFSFVGARSRISVAGHLMPSQDASGRRFPFMTAATVERDDTLMMRCAPAGLSRPFGMLRAAAQTAVEGGDIQQVLADLGELNCSVDFELALQSDPLGHFVRRTSIEGLSEMLAEPHSPESVRRTILAIGLLLRPLIGNAVPVEKEIALPLPLDERHRNLTAALWLYLVSAFLRKSSFELQVLIGRHNGNGRMIIGFNGASPRTLLALWAPHCATGNIVYLDDPEWIEDHHDLTHDYGVAKLASYLSQPAITLEAAINTFREVFLGE